MKQQNIYPNPYLKAAVLAMMGCALACGAAHAQRQQHQGGQQQARPTRATPESPATTPNKDYPLKIHVLDGEAATLNGSSVGVGSANLVGEKTLGFDYTFECDAAIGKNSTDDEFYQGKWKKQDKELEVLSQSFDGKVHKCKLKVGMRDFAYDDTHKPPPLPAVQRQGRGKQQQ